MAQQVEAAKLTLGRGLYYDQHTMLYFATLSAYLYTFWDLYWLIIDLSSTKPSFITNLLHIISNDSLLGIPSQFHRSPSLFQVKLYRWKFVKSSEYFRFAWHISNNANNLVCGLVCYILASIPGSILVM